MSVTDVTARIQQIQAQLAMLAPPTAAPTTAPTTGADFAATLDATSGASSGAPSTGGSAQGDAVVAEARKYLGVPYVWGGTDPKTGLDCSGLVQHVYQSLGYDLPRVAADQARQGRPVASLADAQPGDLLAWDNNPARTGADHIAIYIGDGKMIEAARPGTNVRISDVYGSPIIRRILPDATAATNATGSTTGWNAITGTALRTAAGATPYADLFAAAAQKYGVPAALLSAVAQQESGFNPTAVSHAGAKGLMQLMPGTAQRLGVNDPFDPAQAIDGGAHMLRDLTQRFGSLELALAAYNAGPGAVLKYQGIPPYPETQRYVRNVLSLMKGAA